MVVQHNMQAMNANRMLNITTNAQSKSSEKLSSGYRINRAADDAAGLSISEKMRKQIRGLDQASTNAEDGVSAVQTAEGALTEVHDMLQRMNELAVQAANGTNSESDRQSIQDEIDQLTSEIDRVAETTKFNETYLLKGSTSGTSSKVNVAAHDAGLDGKLVDNGNGTTTFTLNDALEVGDTVTIAGEEYNIVDSAKTTDYTSINEYNPEKGDTLVQDGKTYVYVTATGTTPAGQTAFQPYAYGTDTVASFTVNLYDDDNTAEHVSIAYEYDFSDLFANDNLKYDVTADTNGNYVYDNASNTYVLYDSANASHANATRYNIDSVSLDTGSSTLEDYLDSYIRNTILSESLSGTTMSLVSDYSGYRVSTRENNNAAMITEYNTPRQVAVAAPKEEDAGSLLIQCTAKTNDFISLEKQKLSLRKLGISKLSVATETKATKAITLIGDALSNLNTVRSRFGSYQNRLEHAHAINENSAENTQSSESTIRDTDMAEEIVRYSINNVLAQAGQAVLAQANQSTQGVLSLLG